MSEGKSRIYSSLNRNRIPEGWEGTQEGFLLNCARLGFYVTPGSILLVQIYANQGLEKWQYYWLTLQFHSGLPHFCFPMAVRELGGWNHWIADTWRFLAAVPCVEWVSTLAHWAALAQQEDEPWLALVLAHLTSSGLCWQGRLCALCPCSSLPGPLLHDSTTASPRFIWLFVCLDLL